MLFTPLQRQMRETRHWVVGCLLLALTAYGISSTLVQLLGVTHSHRSVASTVKPLQAWVDGRSAPRFTKSIFTHRQSQGQSHTQLHTQSQSQSHTQSHAHSLLERHHHGADDETVLALERPVKESALSEASSGSSSFTVGSAALVLALADELLFDPDGTARFGWTTAQADPVPSRTTAPLERPPNAL